MSPTNSIIADLSSPIVRELPTPASLRTGERGKRVRVAQFGMGPIGVETIRLLAERSWCEVVGAVDIDPLKIGKRITDLSGVEFENNPTIFGSFDELMDEAAPDVVLHTAGSKILPTFAQIEPMVAAGVSVVSSCEELLYPWHRAPQRSEEIDALCKTTGAGVVGTGVNPGFVLDVLPITLTGVSRRVDSIYGERVVNASTRRMPLQKKIGSGMDPDEFRALFAAGKAGHAGFQESARLVCHAMGWDEAEVIETCEPVIASHDITTQFLSVKEGLTCGIHQRVEAMYRGRLVLELDLKMYLDAPNPHDMVRIVGDPPIEVEAKGGIAGDHATVAALVNAVPRIRQARAGLLLMTDLAVPCWA